MAANGALKKKSGNLTAEAKRAQVRFNQFPIRKKRAKVRPGDAKKGQERLKKKN